MYALLHVSKYCRFVNSFSPHQLDLRTGNRVAASRNIRGPFMAKRPEGRERLQRLLSEVMIRHTKADVLAIPPPVRESALLAMSQQETLAYDTIVSFVR